MDLDVISELSRGEATESLLVRDPVHGKVVVERTYPHEEAWNPVTDASLESWRTHFAEQMQHVQRVADPAVLAVYDVGIADGRAFVMKEYVDAPVLETWAEQQRTEAILGACKAVGRAFASVHAAGLCQLPPRASRIFVARDAAPRLHAFGALRLPGTSQGSGAPWNRAPESFARSMASEPALFESFNDALTDQWGLAALIWQLVYGQPPVMRESHAALVEAIRRGERDEPPANAAPSSLRPVLERAMALERSARFPSMSAFLDALPPVIPHR